MSVRCPVSPNNCRLLASCKSIQVTTKAVAQLKNLNKLTTQEGLAWSSLFLVVARTTIHPPTNQHDWNIWHPIWCYVMTCHCHWWDFIAPYLWWWGQIGNSGQGRGQDTIGERLILILSDHMITCDVLLYYGKTWISRQNWGPCSLW